MLPSAPKTSTTPSCGVMAAPSISTDASLGATTSFTVRRGGSVTGAGWSDGVEGCEGGSMGAGAGVPGSGPPDCCPEGAVAVYRPAVPSAKTQATPIAMETPDLRDGGASALSTDKGASLVGVFCVVVG